MTIKKNTLIIICSIIIVFVIFVYFINNLNVVQFKDNSVLAQNKETINNNVTINKTNEEDKQKPVVNDNEPINSTGSKETNDNFIKNDIPIQNEPTYTNKEEEVLSYFRILENDTEENTKEGTLNKVKDKINSAFFTTVDFIFYDKEIKGMTFNDLSDKAKVEILEIASNIDSIITKKFPNYKETIKGTGNKTYEFISEKIGKLKNKIRDEIGPEKYNSISETLAKSKEKILDLKDSAIDVTGNTWGKLKDWYEKNRENRN